MTIMKTTFYFVRHAKVNKNNHDDMTRELSAEGFAERILVTNFLADKNIDILLSSPYKRAVDTIADFAEKNDMEIRPIDDFRERKITDEWIADFETYSKKQWEDMNYKLKNGESLMEVQNRNIRALNCALEEYRGKNIVVGSHGTALSTVINFFDKSFGYEDFNEISDIMPWIVKFVFEDDRCVEMEKVNLFES